MYSQTKSVERCQCYTRGIALADAHGSSYFFRNDDTSEVVDPSYNSCSLHIYKISLFYRFVLLVSAKGGDLYLFYCLICCMAKDICNLYRFILYCLLCGVFMVQYMCWKYNNFSIYSKFAIAKVRFYAKIQKLSF